MSVRAGTRGGKIVGYLEQEVLDKAVDGSPDDMANAIALVAARLDEKAGPWAWWAERFWKWAYSWKTESGE